LQNSQSIGRIRSTEADRDALPRFNILFYRSNILVSSAVTKVEALKKLSDERQTMLP